MRDMAVWPQYPRQHCNPPQKASIVKSGIQEILGKTIVGVLATQNDNELGNQVFLSFSDGTWFEIYGRHITCAGGVCRGTDMTAKDYAVNRMAAEIIAECPLPNIRCRNSTT